MKQDKDRDLLFPLVLIPFPVPNSGPVPLVVNTPLRRLVMPVYRDSTKSFTAKTLSKLFD